MATPLEDLQAAYAGACSKLREALSGDYSKAIELKPNFKGTGADRIEYMRVLEEIISSTREKIAAESGPWESVYEVDT